MLRRVGLVRIDVSEKLNASIIRVTGIGELGTMLVVTSNREDVILHNHRRKSLKSYAIFSSSHTDYTALYLEDDNI
jgi:hypothetical protein